MVARRCILTSGKHLRGLCKHSSPGMDGVKAGNGFDGEKKWLQRVTRCVGGTNGIASSSIMQYGALVCRQC